MVRKSIITGILACATLPAQAAQHSATTTASPVSKRNYAYEFLIGEWVSQSATAKLRQSFAWGPNKSYIEYATFVQPAGMPEQLHFAGIMVWNARTEELDFLFVIEPGSGAQEKGTVKIASDGAIVREVELTRNDGTVSHFRQVFRQTGPNLAVTSLMRRTDDGWQPSFPGADKIEMRRTKT